MCGGGVLGGCFNGKCNTRFIINTKVMLMLYSFCEVESIEGFNQIGGYAEHQEHFARVLLLFIGYFWYTIIMWVHRLSSIDKTNKTATCSNCGLVKIGSVGRGFYRCRNKLNETSRVGKYRRKYGVTTTDIPKECDLCGGTTRIAYDHCHKSGEFRGWLCMKCNTALGLVNDDTALLQKMIAYLS